MIIIGHRGLAHDNIENTISAIQQSSDHCDLVEIDVRETADNIPIVLHDPDLKRVAGLDTKDVNELTYNKLESILNGHYSSKEQRPAPKLSDVLNVCETDLLVEMKGDVKLDNVLPMLEAYESDISLQSFKPEYLDPLELDDFSFGLLCPTEDLVGEIGVPINTITDPFEAIDLISSKNGDFISTHINHCSEAMMSYARSNNLDIFVWTIRDSDMYENAVSMNVDGVITDSISYIQR